MPERDQSVAMAPEEELRREVEALRREVKELRGNHAAPKQSHRHSEEPRRPNRRTLWLLGLLVLAVLVAAFFLGWVPHRRRETKVRQEARQEAGALPQLNYILAQRSAPTEELRLPGTTQALVDAPLLARASGFLGQRMADIGDRVKKGQVLAVIAAPDLDQQVVQAVAQTSQTEAALKQASANLEQGRANEALGRVTATRYATLVQRGAVSRQDNDAQQATWQAQVANLDALQQAFSAAAQNLASARANEQRLQELRSFERVTAPFDGVVTLRNTDVGALITNGTTLLFRVAQTDRLRTYINVPQPNAPSVRAGQEAEVISPEMGGKKVVGRVTRTADALDPATRTLLTEVQVANANQDLLPGMYVEVNLKSERKNPPILVPGDAVIAGAEGTRIAVFRDTTPFQQENRGGVVGTIHLQQIQVGRDYGAATEVTSGLQPGDMVIVNPNDDVRENVRAEGMVTTANPDVQNGSPGGGRGNANTERLQPTPTGEQHQNTPSRTDKNRGPGY